MARAAECLKGTHDFHSFETRWPNRASSVRTITHLSVKRLNDYICIEVEADGFLYNMVQSHSRHADECRPRLLAGVQGGWRF